MSTLKLKGSTSGYVELTAPAVAGDNQIVLPTTAGTVAVKDASGNTEVGTGVTIGSPSSNVFTLSTNGGERLRVDSVGNIGIGSTQPTSKLDITGDVKISGISTLSNVTVGGATTELVVNGDARVTGILTVGTASLTLNGTTGAITGGSLTNAEVAAISSSIADTAVDVFVYDTSKDSDGGAWRHRTQHTSWYNETLNTATRGSRREFPAVAVIVAESNQVTIYDGDDPDLPMWMVFNQGGSYVTSNNLIGTTAGTNSAIICLNGILSLTTGNEAIYLIKFISDTTQRITNSADREYLGGIGERNSGKGLSASNSTNYIVNASCNDVAMTVLPNAPIDDATGLPIPTIAVATAGGVSVIKDDGTVVDGTSASGSAYSHVKVITITEEKYLWWLADNFDSYNTFRDSYALSLSTLPSSDFTWDNSSDNLSTGTYYAVTTGNEGGEIKIGPVNTWSWSKQERNALGGPSGLAIHKPNIGSESNSLIVGITSSYNTGWMHGDIKGAFLSDTVVSSGISTVVDRSVNNNGLEVFGTITTNAVATGADLVGYSGYSSSNYLVQPNITAPGTGDFSITSWIKPGSANGTGGNYFHLFSLGTSSTGGQSSSTGFTLKFAAYSGANSSGFVPYFYSGASGGTNFGTYNTNNYLPLGVWSQFVAVRRGGIPYFYINGKLVQTGTSMTTNFTDTFLHCFIDGTYIGEVGGEADVSLLRYSLSAPSPEQIKKIYEDEKVLFQENAACTLYGSSDAVTALAYDDSNSILSVGTSSGRSDFQGLRRINNTTTAVTTAISAHDEFIVEQ